MRKSNGEFEAEIFRRFDEYKEKKKKRHRAVRAASLCMAVVLLGAAVVLVLLQTVWGVGYRLRKDNEPS